ncbi:DNA replication protein [Rhizobium leguminosarum bv. trifolii WSM2012]|nr:DNA replication protein [Rhizobium leguminosarum bv. trifolii WSM2012]
MATARSKPPPGRARWTLELLADEMVRLTDHDALYSETGVAGWLRTISSLGAKTCGASKDRWGIRRAHGGCSALVGEMMEARDERRLLRFQKQMAAYKLLIVDELGFVPLSKTGAELLFELIAQCYERGATLITSNLPFDEWTEAPGSERLTGHHVNILEMNGDSYRLAQSRPKGRLRPFK